MKFICNELAKLVEQWNLDLEFGAIYGRPLSPRTQSLHQHNIKHVLPFLDDFTKLPQALVKALSSAKQNEDAKKMHIYDATISFAKSLVFHQLLKFEVLGELKKYRPKRFKPPKRTVARESDIQKLLRVNSVTSGNSKYDRLLLKVVIIFIFHTALRSQEFIDLSLKNLDLKRREITVEHGKGNKTRRIGLNDNALDILLEYLSNRPESHSDRVFLLKSGREINRIDLAHRFKRLVLKAGLDLSLHSLRRGFATENAEKGRPLVRIQTALGHSSLLTTQKYILPDVEEAINSMKSW